MFRGLSGLPAVSSIKEAPVEEGGGANVASMLGQKEKKKRNDESSR